MRWRISSILANRVGGSLLLVVTAVGLVGGTVELHQGPGGPPPRLGFQGNQYVPFRPAEPGDILFPVEVNGWWGYANQAGVLNIYPVYEWTGYFHDHLARVVIDGKTGFISKGDTMVIPARYPYADRFQDGFAIVGDGHGHFGFINQAGQLIVPIKLTGALRFREGYAAVQVGKRIGFINKAGGVLVRPQFAKARSFHDHRAMVQAFGRAGKPGMVGYLDRAGQLLWKDRGHRFSDLGSFYDGLARAKVGHRWGFIDQSFQLRIAARFEDARHFENGLAAVEVHGKWGYIDKTGQFQIRPQFESADDFEGVYAMVEVGGRFGYVNQNGSGGIRPEFDHAEPFYRKRARVSMQPNFGYIDVSGQTWWDPRDVLNEPLVDVGAVGQIVAKIDPNHVGNPVLSVPKGGKSRAPAYPPDYEYPDVLPQPGGAFGAS